MGSRDSTTSNSLMARLADMGFSFRTRVRWSPVALEQDAAFHPRKIQPCSKTINHSALVFRAIETRGSRDSLLLCVPIGKMLDNLIENRDPTPETKGSRTREFIFCVQGGEVNGSLGGNPALFPIVGPGANNLSHLGTEAGVGLELGLDPRLRAARLTLCV